MAKKELGIDVSEVLKENPISKGGNKTYLAFKAGEEGYEVLQKVRAIAIQGRRIDPKLLVTRLLQQFLDQVNGKGE